MTAALVNVVFNASVHKNVYKHFHCSFLYLTFHATIHSRIISNNFMIVFFKRRNVAKFNGNLVNLAFNATIYARMVL